MTVNVERTDWWIKVRVQSGEFLPIFRVLCYKGPEKTMCIIGLAMRVQNIPLVHERMTELSGLIMEKLQIVDSNTIWVEYYPEELSPIHGEFFSVNTFGNDEHGIRACLSRKSVRRIRVEQLLSDRIYQTAEKVAEHEILATTRKEPEPVAANMPMDALDSDFEGPPITDEDIPFFAGEGFSEYEGLS